MLATAETRPGDRSRPAKYNSENMPGRKAKSPHGRAKSFLQIRIHEADKELRCRKRVKRKSDMCPGKTRTLYVQSLSVSPCYGDRCACLPAAGWSGGGALSAWSRGK